MLEKAIEIEGLLRIIRDGNPLPETYILLNIKSAELAEQALRLEERAAVAETGQVPTQLMPEAALSEKSTQETFGNETPEHPDPSTPRLQVPTPQAEEELQHEEYEPEKEQPIEKKPANQAKRDELPSESEIEAVDGKPSAKGDFVLASATSIPEQPPVIFTEDYPELSHKSSEAEQTEQDSAIQSEAGMTYPNLEDEDLDLTDDDDILLDFEDTAGFSSDGTETPEEEQKPITIVTPELEILVSDITNTGKEEVKGGTDQLLEIKSEPDSDAVDSDATTKPKRQIKLKSAFSLNDRFLYSRELFEGNMKMFDSTLEFIEGIDDYSIIEDYFYSELEWDPEDRNVATFMEILRPHFKEL